MDNLKGKRIAVLAVDGFEEPELVEPVKALREAGATVDIASEKREPIQGFHHHDKASKVDVDTTLDAISADQYDAVLLPGGALNADAIRSNDDAQEFVQAMDAAGKPMAVICHAPWLLVSANLLKGRTLTSWPSVADDIRNAGGAWVDKEVVVDRNLISSRKPDDIPAFNRAIIETLNRSPQPVT